MTTHVQCAKPEKTIEEWLRLMTEHDFRYLPALDAYKKLSGIIPIGGLGTTRLDEQNSIIIRRRARPPAACL